MGYTEEEKELIRNVCKGNAGALRLCADLVTMGRADVVQSLQRLKITGPRVWLLYKDIGGEKYETLISNVENADVLDIRGRLAALGYPCD